MAVRDVRRVMMGARVQRARRAMAVRGRCASTSPRRLVPGRDHHTTGGGSRLRPERIALRLVMHLVVCLVVCGHGVWASAAWGARATTSWVAVAASAASVRV